MYPTYKKTISSIVFSVLAIGITQVFGQSANKNYIRTRVPMVPLATEAALDAASGDATKVQVSIQYLDGLGRPLQSVKVKGNANGTKDIVTPITYDQYGRETTKYLPYAASGTANGNYRSTSIADQLAFYAPATSQPGVVRTTDPYAVSIFEASPLNRVTEQGFPGTVWKPAASRSNTTGRTVLTENFSNTDGTGVRKIRLYKALNPNGTHTRRLSNVSWYPANRLSVTITKDENWISTNGVAGTVEEYKDNEDKVLLKRFWRTTSEALSTYYVYDDYGNLCYVLPPGVNPDGTAQLAQAQLDGFCYQYRYDNRNRLIEKKLPGKGWEFIIYNKLDQVTATQDSIQRMKTPLQQASFTKYDALGRVVFTGYFRVAGTTAGNNYRARMQDSADAQTTLWEVRKNVGATGTTDYSKNTYPRAADTALTTNYYDSYDYIPGRPATGMPSAKSSMLKGLLTASKTAVLNNPNQILWELPYYDDEGKVITAYKQHYKGATSTVRNYDLINTTYAKVSGLVINVQRKHYVVNSAGNGSDLILTVNNSFVYDHMGRKTQTWQRMTNGSLAPDDSVLISRLEYNEIGQLWNKYLHTTNLVTNNFKQKISQLYNTRGWLSQINDPDAVTATSIFGTKLFYDEGTSKYFNGNIGGISWQTKVPVFPPPNNLYQAKQTYTYTYDAINRLTKARYNTIADKFNEEITYDKMGNITFLKRKNDPGATNFLNDLTYTYTAASGNKLVSVSDVGTANQDASYTYDGNGSVITDTRNQITGITYNVLNLPQTVIRTPGNITYFYDASGQKLRKSVVGGAVRDYIDGLEYGSSGIDFISTEEGRVRPTTGTDFVYEYFLKDHLGNTRAAIMENGDIVQVQDYYAFGLEMNPGNGFTPTPDNKYRYNGKEKQDETGQLDYGARFYDPVIARWGVIDPKSEKYESISPYSYAFNNPVRFIDIKGQDPGDIVILFSGAAFSGGTTPSTSKIGRYVATHTKGGQVMSYASNFNLDFEDGTQGAYDQILSNYKSDPKGRVVIYGYSYGGTLALYLAKRLERVGINVTLLITVDGANGWRSSFQDREVPDNVESNENYYETNTTLLDPTFSHGEANKGNKKQVKNHNMSGDSFNGQAIDHMNIDDATVQQVNKKVTDLINNTVEEKKVLTKDEIKDLFE